MGVGLILQGGGSRGLYTCGVLDCFLHYGLRFDDIYAVSAGGLNAVNYISGQKGRSLKINMRFCNDSRFIDARRILSGDMCNLNFVFNELPDDVTKLDNITYKNSGIKLTVVATDVQTAQPAYLKVDDISTDYDKVMASGALPMFVKPVKIDGRMYIDGGVTDPLPLAYSISCGNQRNVVIMTRPDGYRKKPSSHISTAIGRLRYKEHPQLLRVGVRQHDIYNKSATFVEQQEAAGNAFVLRPSVIKTKQIERNPLNLLTIYNRGFAEARAALPAIKAFLEGDNG